MVSNLKLYKRADSKEKGRHLVATQDIRKNQLILVEKPLLSLQSLGNSHQGALVCRQCRAFIGGPDMCLAVSSGRLERENVWGFYKDMQKKNSGVDQGYMMISCRNKCGELFCSKECEEDFWFNGGHELMCTGLIPASPPRRNSQQETKAQSPNEDESGFDNNKEREESSPEANTMHPLLKFKVHAVQSNEIFLMVGDLVATVISMRRQQIESQILAEKEGLGSNSNLSSLDDLLAPYLDFTLIPWWQVATRPMMSDPNCDSAAIEHLDATLRELCSISAQLLRDAILMILEEEASKKKNQLFCSTLRQAINECEEKYAIFSSEFFGKIIGSFEQNAMGIRARHPICRDIIEDQSFRERCKKDIFTCLKNAGMIEGHEEGDINNQNLDGVDRAITSLYINEEGNVNDFETFEDEAIASDDLDENCNDDCSDDADHSNESNADNAGNLNDSQENEGGDDYEENTGQDHFRGDDLDILFTPLDGTAMYYTTCKMNHSCDPNVVTRYLCSCSGGGKSARWGRNFPLAVSCCALKDIKKGEELCISYINGEMEYDDRVKALANYGFVCICEKCNRQRNCLKAVENEPEILEGTFPEEDDLFPGEDDLFSADDDSVNPGNDEDDVEFSKGNKSLLELESDLNLNFSTLAHDSIPIQIVAPTIAAILNFGKRIKREFREDLASGEILTFLEIVVKSLEDRNYVTSLEKSLVGESNLFSILQATKEWPSVAQREAHHFFALAGGLGHAFTLNFLPAMKLIDKAVILGLSRRKFSRFIEYVELHASNMISEPTLQTPNLIANYQESILKDLVQKEGLPIPINSPIEEVGSDCSHEVFMQKYYSSNRPVVIRGFAKTWPAVEKWRDLRSIVRKYGHRIVPIELGNMNEITGLQEQLMSIREFVKDFLIPSNSRVVTPLEYTQSQCAQESIAYLAQHQLFEHIPDLMNGINASPSFCGENGPTHINAWIGTGGTRTPCHFDSYDNFLVQIVGAKYIRLYESKEATNLYVIKQAQSSYVKQGNMSAVDCEVEDYSRHPLSRNAKFSEVILYPGDCLYIPAKEWHYVRSLSSSASINFWF